MAELLTDRNSREGTGVGKGSVSSDGGFRKNVIGTSSPRGSQG